MKKIYTKTMHPEFEEVNIAQLGREWNDYWLALLTMKQYRELAKEKSNDGIAIMIENGTRIVYDNTDLENQGYFEYIVFFDELNKIYFTNK